MLTMGSVFANDFRILRTLAAGGYALLRAAANARRRELDAVAAWAITVADTHQAIGETSGPYRSR